MKFDKQHGSFHIHREEREAVTLDGKGLCYYWTRRALEREGFVVEKKSRSSVLRVECGVNGEVWRVHEAGNISEFTSIYSLIVHLRRGYHSLNVQSSKP